MGECVMDGSGQPEVGSNAKRCAVCGEVVHEDNVFRHLRKKHTEEWAAITLDERTVNPATDQQEGDTDA